jgi:hypothetical protein
MRLRTVDTYKCYKALKKNYNKISRLNGMKIYVLDYDYSYRSIVPIEEHLFDQFEQLGKSLIKNWQPIKLKVPESKKEFPRSDFPNLLTYVPVFSPKSKGMF